MRDPSSTPVCHRGPSGRGLMGPVLLITLGVLLLVGQYTTYDFNRTWPVLLIVVGLVRMLARAGTPARRLEPNHSRRYDSAASAPAAPTPAPRLPQADETNNQSQGQVNNA